MAQPPAGGRHTGYAEDADETDQGWGYSVDAKDGQPTGVGSNGDASNAKGKAPERLAFERPNTGRSRYADKQAQVESDYETDSAPVRLRRTASYEKREQTPRAPKSESSHASKADSEQSNSGYLHYSDDWDEIDDQYEDEIEPSDSASAPAARHRSAASRRHRLPPRPYGRPSRAPRAPPSLDDSDDYHYPAYGPGSRPPGGYYAPSQPGYGPPPVYGGYAPNYPAGYGGMVPYGAQNPYAPGYQSNPFSPGYNAPGGYGGYGGHGGYFGNPYGSSSGGAYFGGPPGPSPYDPMPYPMHQYMYSSPPPPPTEAPPARSVINDEPTEAPAPPPPPGTGSDVDFDAPPPAPAPPPYMPGLDFQPLPMFGLNPSVSQSGSRSATITIMPSGLEGTTSLSASDPVAKAWRDAETTPDDIPGTKTELLLIQSSEHFVDGSDSSKVTLGTIPGPPPDEMDRSGVHMRWL